MWKERKLLVICKALAVLFLLALVIGMARVNLQAMEPIVEPERLQKYNQVQELNGYTVRLTHGIYSDATRTGFCIFEVERKDGKMEVLTISNSDGDTEIMSINDGQVDSHNNFTNDIGITPNSSGSISNVYGGERGGKLTIYSKFKMDPPDPKGVKSYNRYQITLNYEEDYGFHLEDNCLQKTYEVDHDSKLMLSYFGLSIESGHRYKALRLELETKNARKVLVDTEKDIYGSDGTDLDGLNGGYSEYNSNDIAYNMYNYSYTFNEINFDIDKITAIYVNGKKISTVWE